MKAQLNESRDDLLHQMDAILTGSMQFERLQKMLLDRILHTSASVVRDHCILQQDNLRVISKTTSLSQIEQMMLENCFDGYLNFIDAPIETIDEIDVVFSGVETVDQESLHLITSLKEKLEADEKSKAAAKAIQDNNETLKIAYKRVALGTLLIVGGVLLTGLTVGLGADEGVALIGEGMNSLSEAADVYHGGRYQTVQPNDRQGIDSGAMRNLVGQLEGLDERNRELLNVSWVKMIESHCKLQQQSLETLKDAVSDVRLPSLINDYAHSLKMLDEIKCEKDEVTKTQAIQNLSARIQEADRLAGIIVRSAQKSLPASVRPVAKSFLSRAVSFIRHNKQMIKVAGLVALSVVGVGLTVATGGIGGVIGAALLGSVAFGGVKSNVKKRVLPLFEKKVSKIKSLKPTKSDVAKTALAVGAVATLGVLTGGVGLGIAFGCAAVSWVASKVIKKVAIDSNALKSGKELLPTKVP